MRVAVTLGIAFASACAADGPRETDIASIDGLDYAIPVGWKSKNQSEHQTKIIVWSPTDNDRKESIAIMRSRDLPALTRADFARIERLLVDAQTGMPRNKFGAASRVKTKHGMLGARVTGSFVPAGATHPYKRFHAVVIDGDALVHILYTAREPDRETFDLVLDSLTRKKGA